MLPRKRTYSAGPTAASLHVLTAMTRVRTVITSPRPSSCRPTTRVECNSTPSAHASVYRVPKTSQDLIWATRACLRTSVFPFYELRFKAMTLRHHGGSSGLQKQEIKSRLMAQLDTLIAGSVRYGVPSAFWLRLKRSSPTGFKLGEVSDSASHMLLSFFFLSFSLSFVLLFF